LALERKAKWKYNTGWLIRRKGSSREWGAAKKPSPKVDPFFSHPSDAANFPVVALWFAQLDGK